MSRLLIFVVKSQNVHVLTRENKKKKRRGAARPICHLQASCEKGCKAADLGCDPGISRRSPGRSRVVATSSQGAPNRTPKCHRCRWMAPIHLGDLDKLQDSPDQDFFGQNDAKWQDFWWNCTIFNFNAIHSSGCVTSCYFLHPVWQLWRVAVSKLTLKKAPFMDFKHLQTSSNPLQNLKRPGVDTSGSWTKEAMTMATILSNPTKSNTLVWMIW